MNAADGIRTYTGRLLPANADVQPFQAAPGLAQTVEDAHERAAQIVAAAHAEADEIRARRLAGLETEFERRIAERLSAAAHEFESGFRDCGAILVSILEESLRKIIGDPADPKALSRAIEAAVGRHSGLGVLVVHVSPADYPRLEVLRRSASPYGSQAIRQEVDPSLEKGRCILAAGGKRYEIGVEAQIAAFRSQALKLAAGQGAEDGAAA